MIFSNFYQPKEEIKIRVTVADTVDVIMKAADVRSDKIIYPTPANLMYIVKPIIPQFVDYNLKKIKL